MDGLFSRCSPGTFFNSLKNPKATIPLFSVAEADKSATGGFPADAARALRLFVKTGPSLLDVVCDVRARTE